MKYRLLQAKVIDPSSTWNGQILDLDIENGQWKKAAGEVLANTQVIDLNGKVIMPGFCELYAYTGDPGHEYREDIISVTKAAAAGGFTAICSIPDAEPVTQHKTQVEYVLRKGSTTPAQVWPLGAITENLQGKNPTEMYDMHYAGAVAFTDAPNPVNDAGVMLRALQYVQPFNGVIIQIPYNKSLVAEGQVNEGEISVRMGMKGISNLSESLQVHRDLELLEYGGGRLHFSGISTAEAVSQIRIAKAKGLQVTASVYLHHLLLDEQLLSGFDSIYKVMPPLRTQEDIDALWEGLIDGTLDAISTQHTPLDTESKRLEFEYALPGMGQIELAFALSQTYISERLGWDLLVKKWSSNPRLILGKPMATISEGTGADFLVADFYVEKIVNSSEWKSKSFNTPFAGKTLKGRVEAVFHHHQWFKNE
jgi:dihydroorotase